MEKSYQVVVIGGGTSGIMVAARLKRFRREVSVAIIEPSEDHYYQPAFSLVGAGTYSKSKTRRDESSVIPRGVTWIRDRVVGIDPHENEVMTSKNGGVKYEILVVATGLQYDFSLIPGLAEGLKTGTVCSNYVDAETTWKNLQNFKGGRAIFTQPATPIKCGGAPQKAMYMSADYLRKKGLLDETLITFATPGTVIFGVDVIAKTLMNVIDRYGIDLRLHHTPVKIDPVNKLIYFKEHGPENGEKSMIPGGVLTEDGLIEVPFDFLHLAPPQVAPPLIRESGLANESGWMDVDIHSLQHKTFENIFGVGDVADLPTAKTGAAVRKQAPVVVANIIRLIDGKPANDSSYEGYSSCPLVTGYGKMVMAEFNYKNEFTPDPMLKFMGITTSYKEHWRLWILKKYILPFLYWNQMMKGKM